MKRKKLLCLLLIAMISLVSLFAIACETDLVTDPQGGAETGEYYCEAGEREHRLTLHSGNQFILSVNNEMKIGIYTLTGESLLLTFNSGEEAIAATYEGDVVKMTYANNSLQFFKIVMRVVSFNSGLGSAVPSVVVTNGKTIARPEDPTYAGHSLVNWYTNPEFTNVFQFGTTRVTSNITLYAYWGETLPGQQEMTVNFNLNYVGAGQNPESQQTIGRRLFDMPTPTRAGYTFLGWAVSMFEDASKLSYTFVKGETIVNEQTTLFAMWQAEESGSRNVPNAPVVNVSDSAIRWEVVGGVTPTSFRVKVLAPGQTDASVDWTSVQSGTSYTPPFTAAGAYTVKVVAVGTNQTDVSAETVRVYNYKGLSRVSLFSVVNSSVLLFNEVQNATKYLISIDNGNPLQSRNDIDNLNFTSYDFSYCDMLEGGIKFTVKALADGFATSESRTFVYDRALDKITEVFVDSETQTLKWAGVADASGYEVSINLNGSDYTARVASASYSLKEYDAGTMTISVRPVTSGYNSVASNVLTYNKVNIAAPSEVRVDGNVVRWARVKGAVTYTISFGTLLVNTTGNENQYTLSPDQLAQLTSNRNNLSVKANGASSSLFSDAVVIEKNATVASYNEGYVSWNYVLGAVKYAVRLNDDEIVYVNNANSLKITFDRAGINDIFVTPINSSNEAISGQPAKVSVYTYEVVFNGMEGSPATITLFKAFGDPIDDFPSANAISRPGYSIENWYKSPGGAAVNAIKYNPDRFLGGNITLYVHWKADVYNISLVHGNGVVQNTTTEVTFDDTFVVEVPTIDGNGFIGWYSEPNGHGIRYTNEKGISGDIAWTIPNAEADGVRLYAYYADVFNFYETGGAYGVRRGSQIGLVTSLIIPDTYNGKLVTTIDNLNYSALKEVTIGKNVMAINSSAFDGCVNLENFFVISDNNTYRDIDGVLCDREGAELVRYPLGRDTAVIDSSIAVIRANAFGYNTRLTEIDIPANVKTIKSNAFRACTNLATITLNEGLETIEEYAFSNCGFSEIAIPANVRAIGEQAFANCSYLTKISFKGNSTFGLYLGEGAFMNSNIEEVEFLAGSMVVEFGDNAFRNSKLTSMTIPATVEKIGNNAFMNSINLASFTVPNGSALSTLGATIFKFCDNLTEVIFQGNTKLTSIPNNIFGIGGASTAFEKIVLPTGLTTISDFAFNGCVNLRELVIPSSSNFTTLNPNLIKGCTALEEITFPGNVNSVDAAFFNDCINLENIFVTTESAQRFKDIDGVLYNGGITTLLRYPQAKAAAYEVPKTVTTIVGGALQGSSLSSITVEAGSTSFKEVGGALLNFAGTQIIFYPSSLAATTFEIPSTVQEIYAYAFDGSKNLVSVSLQGTSSLATIGNYAFNNCTNLENFDIPSSLTNMGSNVFNGCLKLNNLVVPTSTTTIVDYMFANIKGLTTIIIPETVTSIGASAFANCTSLKTVIFTGASNLETIGASAFDGCTSLESFILPSKVTSIGAYAFRNCSSTAFESVAIPGSVTSIGNYAFANSGLREVTFRASTASAPLVMGTHAFYQNKYLQNVTFAASSNVSNIGDYAFAECQNGASSVFETIDIPSSVETIGDYAFFNSAHAVANGYDANWNPIVILYGLANITLHEGLKTVGAYAFSETAVTEMHFPSTLTLIGEKAFEAMSYPYRRALTTVTFQPASDAAGLTIGAGAFYYQSNLANIDFVEGLKEIGAEAFYFCQGINNTLSFPSTLTTIGEGAFYYCGTTSNGGVGVRGVDDWGGVVSVGASAFYYCSQLRTLAEFPSNLKFIGASAFYGTGLSGTVTMKAGIQYGASVYYNVPFTEIIIESGVTHIPESIFQAGSKRSYQTLTIPASVVSIGTKAFSPGYTATTLDLIFEPGSKLTSLVADSFLNYGTSNGPASIANMPEGIAVSDIRTLFGYDYANFIMTDEEAARTDRKYSVIGGVLFSKDGTTLLSYPAGKIGDYTVPAGTRTIGQYAFNNCFYNNASSNYTDVGVTGITLPQSLETIDNYAFYNSKLIKSVALAGSSATSALASIGNYAFSGCTGLESIALSKNLSSIGIDAFAGATIKTASVDAGNTRFKVENSMLMDITTNRIVAVIGTVSGVFVIPENMSVIGDFAFKGRTDLKEIVIHSDVTRIGKNAFQGCTALEKVTFTGTTAEPDAASKLTQIDEYAFENCGIQGSYPSYNHTGLKTIDIPDSVTSIGNYAFYRAYALATVNIGQGSQLKTIGYSAFSNCALTALPYLPEGLTSIGAEAFYFNRTLTGEFNFPASLANIGTSAFAGCYDSSKSVHVTAIRFADGSQMNTIGSEAFSGLGGLTTLEFGEGSTLTTISNMAFSSTGLTSVTLPDNLDTLGLDAFEKGKNFVRFITTPNSRNFYAESNPADESYGVLFSASRETLISFPSALKPLGQTTYHVPSYVTTIGAGAFKGGSNSSSNFNFALGNVVLHRGITRIESRAFQYAFMQTQTSGFVCRMTIYSTIEFIAEDAFYFWGSGTQITVQGFGSPEEAPPEWNDFWTKYSKPTVTWVA